MTSHCDVSSNHAVSSNFISTPFWQSNMSDTLSLEEISSEIRLNFSQLTSELARLVCLTRKRLEQYK